MTVTITQDLADIAGVADNDTFVFSSPTVRLADDGTTVIGTRPKRAIPVAGVLTVELEPGPCRVSWNRGIDNLDITIPDTDSDLWSLIAGAIGMPPGTTQEQIAAAVTDYLLAHQIDEYHAYANLAAFPGTGAADRLYLAQDTGKLYRWNGSAYIQVADKVAVGLGNVDNTSDAAKPVSTAQAAADGWVSRLGSGHQVPPARVTFFDKADTAYASLPTTMDTGQAVSSYLATAPAAQAAIVGGALKVPRQGSSANAATYVNLDAGSGALLTRVGCRFRFDPTGATTVGSSVGIALTNGAALLTGGTAYRMGLHISVQYDRCVVSKATNASGTLVLTTLSTTLYAAPLDFSNGTEYSVDVYRVGNTAYLFLPDGQRISVTDTDIGGWSGRYGFVEPFLLLGNTDVLPAITEAWYGVGVQYPPAESGLIRRTDLATAPVSVAQAADDAAVLASATGRAIAFSIALG